MNRSLAAAAFALVSALLCIPILAYPHLPLVDIPNHIARLHIAGPFGGALDTYYDYALTFQTNTAVDIIWAMGARQLWTAEEFSNLIMAFYAVSLMASVMTLSRVVQGGWRIWPLATNLIVFNAPYFWGFQNYLLTIPIAIFALAGWLVSEKMPVHKRVLWFVPVCLLLYTMHVLGLLVFMVAVFGREVQRVIAARQDWLKVLFFNIPLAIPFLLPIGLIIYDWAYGPENLFGSGTGFGSFSQRIELFAAPIFSVTSDASPWFNKAGGIILATLLALLLMVRKKQGIRLVFNGKMAGPVIALAILTLLTPAVLNGVALVHIRFPFVLLAVVIASTSWVALQPKHAAYLLALLLTLSVTRVAMVVGITKAHSQEVEQLIRVLGVLPNNSRILPVRDTTANPSPRYWHMQAYAVPVAESFVPTLFLGAHVLHLKEKWWGSAVAQGYSVPWQLLSSEPEIPPDIPPLLTYMFVVDWPQKYTHVLQLNALPPEAFKGLPLELIAQKGGFTIYEITD